METLWKTWNDVKCETQVFSIHFYSLGGIAGGHNGFEYSLRNNSVTTKEPDGSITYIME